MTEPREPGEPMDGEDDVLSPDAERAHTGVQALQDGAPRPLYRERLRRAFASGTLAAAGSREVAAPPPPPPLSAVPGRPRDVRLAPSRARLAVQWAIAAGVVVALFATGTRLNAGSPWRIASVTGVGIAVVDGRPIPLNHLDELERALQPGARVQVPLACEIGIRCAGTMAIQMTAETEAVVPGVPGRWFGRNVEGSIRSGEWRVVTGPRFTGARLAIATPAARIDVTGTTLAVICEPPGTCVCVLEGRVRVGRDASAMVDIEEGRRRYLYLDPAKEMDGDVMRPTEAEALARLHDEAMEEMGAGR